MSETNNTEQEEKTTYTLTPEVFYQGEKLESEEPSLEVEIEEPCPYCKEEITYEQIKQILGSKTITKKDGTTEIKYYADKNKKKIKKSIEYLNGWRLLHKLDTCLRKAHFIAHCAAESGMLAVSEGTKYRDPGALWNGWNTDTAIDSTIISSLKSHLLMFQSQHWF